MNIDDNYIILIISIVVIMSVTSLFIIKKPEEIAELIAIFTKLHNETSKKIIEYNSLEDKIKKLDIPDDKKKDFLKNLKNIKPITGFEITQDDLKSDNPLYRTLGLMNENIQKAITHNQLQIFLNLILGIFFSAGSAFMIIYTIFFSNITDSFNNINDLWKLAPKATATIFLQIIGFFFLKLYRNNSEIKRFLHNDINNALAMRIAIMLLPDDIEKNNDEGYKKTHQKLIHQIFTKDFNQNITKNNTNLELERAKIQAQAESQGYEKILTLVTKLFSK